MGISSTSGYASPDTVSGVTITFLIVAAVAVALRLWTRFHIAQNAGLDDVFICGALLCTIALAICTCIEVRLSIGRHVETLTPQEAISGNKTLYASIAIYNIGLLCTKFSILIQYLRIFPQKHFRMACYVMLFICFAYGSWAFWNALFFCDPVAAFWDTSIVMAGNGSCFNREAVWFVNAGINIATDCTIAVMPLPLLNKLNISKRQRFALMSVFALAGFTCIISILRLVSVYALTHSDDPTYNNGQTAMWSALEINIGIICSCLPTLKSLATRLFPRIFTSYQPSHEEGGTLPYAGAAPGKTQEQRNELNDSFRGSHGGYLRSSNAGFQHSYIRRGSYAADVQLDQLAASPNDIKVTTVLDQFESGAPRRDSSTRNLVDKESLRPPSD